MKDQHKQFSQIYDLLAIRVIVDTIKDCYAVLGAIHSQWKPMPGRFKDYIAMPKANMYQSLHTTVIGPEGKPLEVQIRTKEMHAVAEYGVAAHWAYKEGVKDKVQTTNTGDKLNLFKHIIELQEDTDDASDFMDSVKGELFGDHVYAFTPKGDVLELPKGAGPLDMAYAIHTEVGHHTTGATINGKIVPLNYEIKNGDIVDIRTSASSSGPSRDWMKLVSTRRARNKIKQFFRQSDREENIVQGQEMVARLIHELGYDPKALMSKENLDKVTAKMHYQHADDLLAAIGFGDVQPRGVVNRLTDDVRQAAENERRRQEERELLEEHQTIKNEPDNDKKDRKNKKDVDAVVIEGVDNLLIRLSHCCSPVPGDDIVGYITKGRGVSVHRKDCPNVLNAEQNGERIVAVRWGNIAGDKTNYNADIEVQGYNRNGLLNDVLRTINNNTKYLTSINGKVDHNKMATISISLGTRNRVELQRILDNIKNVADVYVVKRAFH